MVNDRRAASGVLPSSSDSSHGRLRDAGASASRSRRSPAHPRRRVDLRSEKGQSAVEFGLVVPILCAIVLALFDFGKALNYWLNLNHVAAEGARRASVNAFPTDSEYETYVRNRLETSELKTGGTDSVPTGADIDVCLPDGGDVGDPVTIRVSVGYQWVPFVDAATTTVKASATMRLEQKADFPGGGTCT